MKVYHTPVVNGLLVDHLLTFEGIDYVMQSDIDAQRSLSHIAIAIAIV
jgi:hypothetical protein